MLLNLSFQDNALASLRDLDSFSGKDFVHLREIVLKGNPFVERELSKAGGEIRYKRCDEKFLLFQYCKKDFPDNCCTGYATCSGGNLFWNPNRRASLKRFFSRDSQGRIYSSRTGINCGLSTKVLIFLCHSQEQILHML